MPPLASGEMALPAPLPALPTTPTWTSPPQVPELPLTSVLEDDPSSSSQVRGVLAAERPSTGQRKMRPELPLTSVQEDPSDSSQVGGVGVPAAERPSTGKESLGAVSTSERGSASSPLGVSVAAAQRQGPPPLGPLKAPGGVRTRSGINRANGAGVSGTSRSMVAATAAARSGAASTGTVQRRRLPSVGQGSGIILREAEMLVNPTTWPDRPR